VIDYSASLKHVWALHSKRNPHAFLASDLHVNNNAARDRKFEIQTHIKMQKHTRKPSIPDQHHAEAVHTTSHTTRNPQQHGMLLVSA